MKSSTAIKTFNKVIIHTLFWCLSIFIFAIIFRISDKTHKLDFIYSALFHFSIIISVYINFEAISTLFMQGKYMLYALFSIVNVAVTIGINKLTFSKIADVVLSGYYFVEQFSKLEIGILVVLFLAITSALKLAKSWFDLQHMSKRMVEVEKEKIDGELKTLKAQINPHFLFNSLNVIYSLALKNDKATPEVVLKLSDILRYVIYDSTQEDVSLKSEIALLEKYIDLQKYRTEESTPIKFNYETKEDVKIAPLILLTLLENSFKHGIKADTDNVFININLSSDDKKVYFEIENNKGETRSDNQGHLRRSPQWHTRDKPL